MICKRPALFLAVAVGLLAFLPSIAISQNIEYEVKAEFLERFTRFIEWPVDSSVSDLSVPFGVCVIGQSPFGSYLDEMAHEVRIKGKAVKIHGILDPNKLDECQILFISESEKDRLAAILTQTEKRPVLTVADTAGFAENGVLINFYKSGTYVRFEINPEAAQQSGLKFSSRLLKLARLVHKEKQP